VAKGLPPEGLAAIGRGFKMDIPNQTIEAARLRAEQAAAARANQQQGTLDRIDLSRWYNKETGEPAGIDRIGSLDELHQKSMKLNTTQLADAQSLPQLQGLVTSYERLAKELPLSEVGVMSRAGGYANMKAMRIAGEPVMEDLDSINARIANLATAFGGDKRVSDKEMALLKGAVIQDGDTAPGVQRKLNNLNQFMNTRVRSSGLPWLQKKEQAQTQAAPATPQGAALVPGKVGPNGRPIYKDANGYFEG